MTQEDKPIFQDDEDFDEDFFAPEDNTNEQQLDAWKMLIVDDEEDVHKVTQFALSNYVFQGKRLAMINAYSAEEAKTQLQQHPDTAIIILDVVMETNDAGLNLVEYIRDSLRNRFVRIILRTGQPGYAPEQEVILKYDINDYQNKTELSKTKLFTVVTAGLRSYSDMITIESYRQHLEERITERTAELVKLNQDKNEFLGIAAHDLRNPLSAIQGYAEEIIEYLDEMPQEEVIELTQKIALSSRQMSELLTNLLDVNAIESGKTHLSLQEHDMLPILQLLVNHYRERAKTKDIKLHFQPQENEYPAFIDKGTIQQVLDNLISNAVKYSPLSKNIYIRLTRRDKRVRCEIQDEGPGLSQADQQKLFCKFTRLTARPTGGEQSTGLGLFIVKRLVEAMNGKVWCETELGQGATFIVEFPSAVVQPNV
jgi:two-component system, sensor histidine kinase and response regulator